MKGDKTMARKPMVTRTITTTEVTCMSLDITQGESLTQVLVLPRTYKDEKKLIKMLQETFNTDDIKVVAIIDKKEVETLYGMEEQKFISNAQILDPTTHKPINN